MKLPLDLNASRSITLGLFDLRITQVVFSEIRRTIPIPMETEGFRVDSRKITETSDPAFRPHPWLGPSPSDPAETIRIISDAMEKNFEKASELIREELWRFHKSHPRVQTFHALKLMSDIVRRTHFWFDIDRQDFNQMIESLTQDTSMEITQIPNKLLNATIQLIDEAKEALEGGDKMKGDSLLVSAEKKGRLASIASLILGANRYEVEQPWKAWGLRGEILAIGERYQCRSFFQGHHFESKEAEHWSRIGNYHRAALIELMHAIRMARRLTEVEVESNGDGIYYWHRSESIHVHFQAACRYFNKSGYLGSEFDVVLRRIVRNFFDSKQYDEAALYASYLCDYYNNSKDLSRDPDVDENAILYGPEYNIADHIEAFVIQAEAWKHCDRKDKSVEALVQLGVLGWVEDDTFIYENAVTRLEQEGVSRSEALKKIDEKLPTVLGSLLNFLAPVFKDALMKEEQEGDRLQATGAMDLARQSYRRALEKYRQSGDQEGAERTNRKLEGLSPIPLD